MTARAILIDLDNTLLLEDAATFAALARASAAAGPDAAAVAAKAAEAADRLFRDANVFPYADRIGIWWGEALWGDFGGDDPGLRAMRAFAPGFRGAVWRAALSEGGLDGGRAAEYSDAFQRARRSDWAIDPAAIPMLDALAPRYRLALVTNGAPAVQREKLEATGLASRFEAIVISGELGIGKPEPAIFTAALARVGASAEDAVMVGDSLERDIAGAHAAHIRSIWLDRDRSGAPASADARITSLDELPASLDSIGAAIPAARRA